MIAFGSDLDPGDKSVNLKVLLAVVSYGNLGVNLIGSVVVNAFAG